ncbi:MAG TPA: hypothetical protein VIU82_01795 [Bosea sp. (in: a-proteobacteria)]
MSGESLLDANFYGRCLAHLADVRELDFVVPHSLPIPYFGDLERYLISPLRVLTAALNPSDREFPKDQPRFDVERGLRGPAELEAELSAYFRGNPYRSWFSAFEPVINGLDVSYGGKMAGRDYASTALHVDMCSPIATSPTWSKLSPAQRGKLTRTGREIFEWLADELEPHIIVASLGWAHLQEWNSDFQTGRQWERLAEHRMASNGEPLRAPLLVQVGSISSRKGRPLVFVNASAADKPFGRFTTERKQEVGQMLLKKLRRTP